MSRLDSSGVNRRMDPRIQPVEGWVEVDGQRHEVSDVSVSGLLIRPYAGDLATGSSFTFRLHLRDETGAETVIDGSAEVVRVASNQLAAQFVNLNADQYPAFDAYLERYPALPIPKSALH